MAAVPDAVGAGDTVRTIIYEPSGLRLLWRTRANGAPRIIDLRDLEFFTASRTLTLGIDEGGDDVVADLLGEYEVSRNLGVARGALDATHAAFPLSL